MVLVLMEMAVFGWYRLQLWHCVRAGDAELPSASEPLAPMHLALCVSPQRLRWA